MPGMEMVQLYGNSERCSRMYHELSQSYFVTFMLKKKKEIEKEHSKRSTFKQTTRWCNVLTALRERVAGVWTK